MHGRRTVINYKVYIIVEIHRRWPSRACGPCFIPTSFDFESSACSFPFVVFWIFLLPRALVVHQHIVSGNVKLKENFANLGVSERDWLLNVTCNDISGIYVTAHRCAGGLKKKLTYGRAPNATDIS